MEQQLEGQSEEVQFSVFKPSTLTGSLFKLICILLLNDKTLTDGEGGDDLNCDQSINHANYIFMYLTQNTNSKSKSIYLTHKVVC